ncbi:MAG: FtsQ-type POTRA domain-containing protein [Oscillospiraceae bacterium]
MAVKKQGNKVPPNRRQPNPRQTQKSRDELRREQAIKRRKIKRRRQLVFTTFSLFLLIIIGVILSLTVFFKIEKVTVEGKTPYSDDKIVTASEVKIKDNLFLLSKSKTVAKIEEKLPYIGSAEISRKLPSEIVIKVKKTSEKCAIVSGDGYVLTDENNKVLKVGVKEIDPNLIVMSGGSVKKAEIGKTVEFQKDSTQKLILELMQAVTHNKITDITQIDVSDKLDIKMTYQKRIEILVGSSAGLDKKMKFAAEIIEKENERGPTQQGTIDLQSISSGKGSKDKAFFRVKEETTVATTEAPET